MRGSTRKAFRGLVLLMVILSLTLAACSSAAATKKPTNSSAPSSAATEQAQKSSEATSAEKTTKPTDKATDKPSSGGDSIGGAASALSAIKSYKFKMQLAGGTYGDMLSMFGSGDSFTMSGTVISAPSKAAEIDMGGIKMIEVDGKQYMNMGSWIEVPDSGSSSLADSLSPSTMFSSMTTGDTSFWQKGNEEKKNGVTAIHFKADPKYLDGLGSSMGVEGTADWSGDIWIAKDGGYPVSVAIVASADGKNTFKMVFDITNVNDPANKVEKPSV